MKLDGPELWNPDQGVGRELQDVRHDAEVGLEAAQGFVRLRLAQRLELEYLQPPLLGGGAQGIGLGAGLLRRAENAGDLVLAREERLEDGFPEVLLPDDCYSHDDAPS